jgi:Replicative DNA helicase
MNYANILKAKFTLGDMLNVSHDVLHQCSEQSENAETTLDSAEQRIYNFRQGKTSAGPSKLGDIVINDVIPNVTLRSTPEGKARKGIHPGFSARDRYTTGLNKSDLILIGARPAMGKTSFALNIACNARGYFA